MSFEPFERSVFLAYWRKQYKHQFGWRGVILVVPYIAGMAIFAIPIKYLSDKPFFTWLWFPLFFGYLIAFPLIYMRLVVGKEARKYSKCPSCKSPLHGTNGYVVTATSKCGVCGEVILRDDESSK